MSVPKVPWNLTELLAVHVLRLVAGFFLVRVVYAAWMVPGQSLVEITDRLVVVGLVWLALRRHGGSFKDWGLPGRRIAANIAAGLAAGVVLLTVSIYSERLYTSVLYLTPSQHPLVAAVEQAGTWRDLLVPLFLAALAAPVAEEILYRLFTFGALKQQFGLWGGAIGSAAIFALFHFNAYWLAELMVVGTGLALLYYRTGSLLSSITAHSFINTTKILMVFLGYR